MADPTAPTDSIGSMTPRSAVGAAPSAGQARGTRSRTRPWEPIAAVATTLVALSSVIAVVAQRAGRPYLPMQDPAIIDLRVRDVFSFSANTPLVGVYSHYWFNHPGPVLFYLTAPFTWVFSNAPWATLVGFALLQGLAIAWTARLAWKTGGLRWTLAWMAISVLSYVPEGPDVLQLPWNPNVALPFFVLFLLQCWVVARGDPRRLLGLVFVGSFLVQAHIGYTVLVLLLGGWAVVSMAVKLRYRRPVVRASALLWPAVVLVLLWIPTFVLDPIFEHPNNLSRLAHFYITSPNRPTSVGFPNALHYLATEFHWVPTWLGGADPVNPFTMGPLQPGLGWLAIPVSLLATSWLVARRRSRPDLRPLVELVALLLGGCVVSLALIQGAPETYLFYWREVAGVATVVLTVSVIIEASPRRWLLLRAGWMTALAAAVAVASSVLTVHVTDANGPVWSLEPTARSLLATLHREGQPEGRVLVRPWGPTLGGMTVGLIDELAREGKPVYVDPWLGFEFGEGRTATPRQVRWIVVVAENSALYSVGSTFPDVKVLARSHPLPPGQDAELIRLQRRLADILVTEHRNALVQDLGDAFVAFELADVPGLPASDLAQLARLNGAVARQGCLCSVLEFPSGHSPIGPQAPPV